MAYDKQKVIDIALSQVGYREKVSSSGLDSPTANSGGGNYTKYARDLDAIHYFNTPKQNLAWCAVFVCWCFVKAYGADWALRVLFQPEKDNCAAACSYAANYYRQRGRFGLSPKIGAQIFFGQNAGDHTGIVYSYDAARVYTVEGNSDDQVARRSYDLTNPWIAGYGYPDYDALPNSGDDSGELPEETEAKPTKQPVSNTSTCTVKLPLLLRGDASQAVRSMQTLLISRGCNCGKYGADGDFGVATEAAVLAFQRRNGLEADGIVGNDTWQKLLGG
jgi:hypothetical protein